MLKILKPEILPDLSKPCDLFKILLLTHVFIFLMGWWISPLNPSWVEWINEGITGVEPIVLSVALIVSGLWDHWKETRKVMNSLLCGMSVTGISWVLNGHEMTVNQCLKDLTLTGALMFMVFMVWDWSQRKTKAAPEAQLESLVSRMRPHFLFNAINGIIMLLNKSPIDAEEALLDLSDVFRALLKDNTGRAKLEEEIQWTQKYIRIEQMRFGERLKVVMTMDPSVNNKMIPTMVLQPMVENAIIHGIESVGAGTVHVTIEEKDHQMMIRVTNPYTLNGKNKMRKSNGMALGNIQKRLQLMYGTQAHFASSPKEIGLHWEAELTLPIEDDQGAAMASSSVKSPGRRG